MHLTSDVRYANVFKNTTDCQKGAQRKGQCVCYWFEMNVYIWKRCSTLQVHVAKSVIISSVQSIHTHKWYSPKSTKTCTYPACDVYLHISGQETSTQGSRGNTPQHTVHLSPSVKLYLVAH